MSWIFHRSRRVGEHGRLHLSRSGVSYSHRFGLGWLGQLTANTRGRLTWRTPLKGLSRRWGR